MTWEGSGLTQGSTGDRIQTFLFLGQSCAHSPGWLLRTAPPFLLLHSLCKGRQRTLNDLYTILGVRRCGFRPSWLILGKSLYFNVLTFKSRTPRPHAFAIWLNYLIHVKPLARPKVTYSLWFYYHSSRFPGFKCNSFSYSIFIRILTSLCLQDQMRELLEEGTAPYVTADALQGLGPRDTHTSPATVQGRVMRGRALRSLLHSQVWLNHNNHLLLCSNLHLTKCFH